MSGDQAQVSQLKARLQRFIAAGRSFGFLGCLAIALGPGAWVTRWFNLRPLYLVFFVAALWAGSRFDKWLASGEGVCLEETRSYRAAISLSLVGGVAGAALGAISGTSVGALVDLLSTGLDRPVHYLWLGAMYGVPGGLLLGVSYGLILRSQINAALRQTRTKRAGP